MAIIKAHIAKEKEDDLFRASREQQSFLSREIYKRKDLILEIKKLFSRVKRQLDRFPMTLIQAQKKAQLMRRMEDTLHGQMEYKQSVDMMLEYKPYLKARGEVFNEIMNVYFDQINYLVEQIPEARIDYHPSKPKFQINFTDKDIESFNDRINELIAEIDEIMVEEKRKAGPSSANTSNTTYMDRVMDFNRHRQKALFNAINEYVSFVNMIFTQPQSKIVISAKYKSGN